MKVLVGCDGSASSKAALDVAIKHAAAFNAEIIACTSLMVPDPIEEKRADLEEMS
jgi:nucleotide-binding universal stress UspA family protein